MATNTTDDGSTEAVDTEKSVLDQRARAPDYLVMFASIPSFLGVVYLLNGVSSREPLAVLGTSIVATGLFALSMTLVLFATYIIVRTGDV